MAKVNLLDLIKESAPLSKDRRAGIKQTGGDLISSIKEAAPLSKDRRELLKSSGGKLVDAAKEASPLSISQQVGLTDTFKESSPSKLLSPTVDKIDELTKGGFTSTVRGILDIDYQDQAKEIIKRNEELGVKTHPFGKAASNLPIFSRAFVLADREGDEKVSAPGFFVSTLGNLALKSFMIRGAPLTASTMFQSVVGGVEKAAEETGIDWLRPQEFLQEGAEWAIDGISEGLQKVGLNKGDGDVIGEAVYDTISLYFGIKGNKLGNEIRKSPTKTKQLAGYLAEGLVQGVPDVVAGVGEAVFNKKGESGLKTLGSALGSATPLVLAGGIGLPAPRKTTDTTKTIPDDTQATRQEAIVDKELSEVQTQATKSELVETIKQDKNLVKELKKEEQTPTTKREIKKTEKQISKKGDLVNLLKQKENLEKRVESKPQLQKQLNKVNSDIKKVENDISKVEDTRLKKAELFPEEITPTVREDTTPTARERLKTKFTKKRAKEIKKAISDELKERRQIRVKQQKTDQDLLSKEEAKIQQNKDLIQENRRKKLEDVYLKTDNFKEFEDIVYKDTILSDDNKIRLIDDVQQLENMKPQVVKTEEEIKALQAEYDILSKKDSKDLTFEEGLRLGELKSELNIENSNVKADEIISKIEDNIKKISKTKNKNKKEELKKENIELEKQLEANLIEAQQESITGFIGSKYFYGFKSNVLLTQKTPIVREIWNAFSFLGKNVQGRLNTVYFTTPDGIRIPLGDFLISLSGKALESGNRTFEYLGGNKIIKLINDNVKNIDKGYNFVSKNLDTLVPKDTPIGRRRNFVLRKALDNNELHQRETGLKNPKESRNRVLMGYVFGEFQSRKVKLKSDKNKIIKEREDLTKKQKQMILDETVITKEEQDAIFNDIINQFDPEVQAYIRETKVLFDDMIEAFKPIGKELIENNILKYTADDYMHGYITDQVIEKYGKDFDFDPNFNTEKLNRIAEIPDPEKRSDILKNKKNIWYLYDYDPLTIMRSYSNEIGRLIQMKMIEDALMAAANGDKSNKSKRYLKRVLENENSRIYKVIREIYEVNNVLTSKTASRLDTITSYGILVPNTPVMVQNAITTGAYAAAKTASQITSGTNPFTKEVKKSYGPVYEYLYNQGLLIHKTTDPDISVIYGDGSISKKAIKNFEKVIKEKGFEVFAALGVDQAKVINGIIYMNGVVNKKGGGIKEGENLVDAFIRTKNSLSRVERSKIESDFVRTNTDIENNTRGNKGNLRFFDYKVMNTFKGWTRGDISKALDNTEQTVDILLTEMSKLTTDKGNRGYLTSDLSNSIITAVMTGGMMYPIYYGLSKLFFDSEEEQESFVSRMIGDSLLDFWKSRTLFLVSLNIDILGGKVLDIAELVYSLNDPNNNKKEETTKKILLRIFSGLEGELKRRGFAGEEVYNTFYNYQYSPETWDSKVGMFMGQSKELAQYNTFNKRLRDRESELRKLDPNYTPFIGDIISDIVAADFFKRINDFSIGNIRYENKVYSTLDNINRYKNQVMTYSEWLDNAFDGIEDVDTDAFNEAKELLKNRTESSYETTYSQVSNLSKILLDIEGFKQVTIDYSDFNNTLNELKEKNPKMYADFYQNLFSFLKKDGGNPKLNKAQDVFTKNIIASELGGVRFANAIVSSIERLITLEKDTMKGEGSIAREKRVLEVINDILVDLEEMPELKSQVYSAFTELINTNITDENYGYIFDAIRGNKEIEDLYIEAGVYRGALLKLEQQNSIPNDTTLPPKPQDLGTDETIPATSGILEAPTTTPSELVELLKLDEVETPTSQPLLKTDEGLDQTLIDILLKS